MARSLFFLFVIILMVFRGWGQPLEKNEKPMLVVGITVEYLRADYITRYWDTFQKDGIKRLFQGGANFENTKANIHNLKAVTTMPTLYTGTLPSVHGIVGNKWYHQLTEKEVYAIRDDYYLTLGSDSDMGNVSARKLKVFTLGDALKQQSNFRSKVYSVALNAEPAVMSAGHVADAAFWYDPTNGNMISSSYYLDEFPDWALNFNHKQFAKEYITREWDLLLPKSMYKAGFEDDYVLEKGFWERWNTFPYNLERIAKDQENPLEIVKCTPYGNTLIRDFAVQLIENEDLGKDEFSDLLSITFGIMDYANKWYHPSSVEIQEMMIRLDRDIASLLSYLDKKMGTDNYLVFLTSASTMDYPVEILKEEFEMDAGGFSPQNALALLRSYLNIIYGVGEWIEFYNEEQVYLNHNFISKKEINLNEIREKAASFLNQFSGIKVALPANIIEKGNLNNPRFIAIENSYSVQRSGDIVLLLEEGWRPVFRYHEVDYSTQNQVPLVFYGRFVPSIKSRRDAYIQDVVPTISKIMDIFPPDECSGKILTFFE